MELRGGGTSDARIRPHYSAWHPLMVSNRAPHIFVCTTRLLLSLSQKSALAQMCYYMEEDIMNVCGAAEALRETRHAKRSTQNAKMHGVQSLRVTVAIPYIFLCTIFVYDIQTKELCALAHLRDALRRQSATQVCIGWNA